MTPSEDEYRPGPIMRVFGSKWVDRALVLGVLMGGFIAGFSGRAGSPGLSLDEPVRLMVGLMVGISCGFALVERIVNVERQCSATARDKDYLQAVIVDMAREALGIPRQS